LASRRGLTDDSRMRNARRNGELAPRKPNTQRREDEVEKSFALCPSHNQTTAGCSNRNSFSALCSLITEFTNSDSGYWPLPIVDSLFAR
jgi:hypothetical protein